MPTEGGKTDMERIGLFSEMTYITVGDKYVSQFDRVALKGTVKCYENVLLRRESSNRLRSHRPVPVTHLRVTKHSLGPFNEAASKNKQMLPGGSKAMSDLQAGYFDPHFVRIFEGEGYVSMNQMRRRHMVEEAKRNLGKAFLPSSGEKKACGVGSYYGTIGGPVPFFSAQLKPRVKYVAPGKNLYTNPGKKGTGYGYANVTIAKQLSHSADFYDEPKVIYKKENEEHQSLLKGTPFKLNLYPREYFDTNPYFSEKPLPPIKRADTKQSFPSPFKPSSPGKKPGGMKAGTFDPFPSHSDDPFGAKSAKQTFTKDSKIFQPPGGPKSRPIKSIMSLNVKRALNVKNYKTAQVQSY